MVFDRKTALCLIGRKNFKFLSEFKDEKDMVQPFPTWSYRNFSRKS